MAALFAVDPREVIITSMDAVRAIKVSFPRPVAQGDPADRDMHSGQQYALLVDLVI